MNSLIIARVSNIVHPFRSDKIYGMYPTTTVGVTYKNTSILVSLLINTPIYDETVVVKQK